MENNTKHQGNKSGIQFMHVRTEGAESFCARSTCFMIFFSYHYHTDGEGYNDTEWKMVEYK